MQKNFTMYLLENQTDVRPHKQTNSLMLLL
jgi:hypothetical protein